VGGGTTDIAVISLGGIVVSASIKVAGDKFDEAISRYMRKKHNIMIGERTAEELKINIGTGLPRVQEVSMEIRGRNLISGLPKNYYRYFLGDYGSIGRAGFKHCGSCTFGS